MPITVTFRDGVAAVGGLIAVAGLFVLLWPITTTMHGPFGAPRQVPCGSALVTTDVDSQFRQAACADHIGQQRGWGWPILFGGVAVAAAALAPNPGQRYAGEIGNDTSGDHRRP